MQNHVLYAHVCNASCTSVFGCICMTVFYAHVFDTVIRCVQVLIIMCDTQYISCAHVLAIMCTSSTRTHTHTVDHFILYNQYK